MKFGFLKSKICLVFALGLIVLLAYANLQIYQRNNKEKLNLLKKEFQEEQSENQRLADLKKYFADDAYLERQAREKFKMQKPGEKVIMIKEIESMAKNQISPKNNLPNILKWWDYLFGARQ